jgi:hypothetical protein
VEPASITVTILPIRQVSGAEPPEPFIKLGQFSPHSSTNPNLVVTSAITPEDLHFWSEIAK